MSEENKAETVRDTASGKVHEDKGQRAGGVRDVRASKKIKSPNKSGGRGFLWAVLAIIAIAAMVVALLAWQGSQKDSIEGKMPQQDVNFTAKVDGSAVELASPNLKDGAPTVEIFEDFSCPHCAELNEADQGDVRQALNDGRLKVRYNLLTFMDRKGPDASTREAGAAMAVAKTGNAKAFWNLHDYLMEEQATVVNQWGNEELGKAASAYDLDGSVVDSIKNSEAEKLGEEVGKANGDELTKRIQTVSSPVVFVDGKQYQIKAGPDGKPKSWVSDVVK
ncbi:DsbA family protein [Corynebacterium heidelbergense]|nr:thioredoxin domain-containing protein [Corynebacterium heidelbergense]